MAKGREPKKQRTDSERRIRQCERFARLIRVTQLLMGNARWGPNDIARELECSVRTVYRDITTLSMAGVPIHFDKECACYRVPEGFRFPGFEPKSSKSTSKANPTVERGVLEMVDECQILLNSIRAKIEGI